MGFAARTNVPYLPQRRAMMQQWVDMLDALAKVCKVIPLQRQP